jgi:hypothetical protein
MCSVEKKIGSIVIVVEFNKDDHGSIPHICDNLERVGTT